MHLILMGIHLLRQEKISQAPHTARAHQGERILGAKDLQREKDQSLRCMRPTAMNHSHRKEFVQLRMNQSRLQPNWYGKTRMGDYQVPLNARLREGKRQTKDPSYGRIQTPSKHQDQKNVKRKVKIRSHQLSCLGRTPKVKRSFLRLWLRALNATTATVQGKRA